MKKFTILAMALVLSAAVLTGCGCRNSQPMNTKPSTRPTLGATNGQDAGTQDTQTTPQSTIQDGNGPIGDMTNATAGADGNTNDTTGAAGGSRSGGAGGTGAGGITGNGSASGIAPMG